MKINKKIKLKPRNGMECQRDIRWTWEIPI